MPTKDSTLTYGLPPNLIQEIPVWEVYHMETDHSPFFRKRIYANGAFYTYANKRRIKLDNGFPGFEDAEFKWRLDALVKPEGVEQIIQALKTNFIPLASQQFSARDDYGREAVIIKATVEQTSYYLILNLSESLEAEHDVYNKIMTLINGNIVSEGVSLIQD